MLIKRGHESVLEHANMTIRVSGVSRAFSHQLVRHRIAAYTQKSQRFVNEKEFNYIIPESIKKNSILLGNYKAYMKVFRNLYIDNQISGIPNEDARFVLPNATETEIVMTTNMREWRHVLNLRGSLHAQWEIRKMAIEVYNILKEKCPSLVSDFQIQEINEKIFLEKIS